MHIKNIEIGNEIKQNETQCLTNPSLIHLVLFICGHFYYLVNYFLSTKMMHWAGWTDLLYEDWIWLDWGNTQEHI